MNQDEIQQEILKTLYIEWFGGRDRVGLRYLANERQWERKEVDKAVEQLKHEYFIEIVAADLHGRITAYGILEAESAGIAPAELREKSEAMRARILERLGRAWDEHGPHHHVDVDDLHAASGSGVGHIRTCLRLLKELGHIKAVSGRSYKITPAGYEQVQEWRRTASLASEPMPEKSDETNTSTSHAAPSIEILYSYSHKDEDLRDKLDAHLSVLRRNGVITGWHDRRISAGSEWERSIDAHLESAGIILLLVSADFLASDYCYEKEMERAMERHHQGTARVIPIILRNCDWSDAPFGKLQALPKDGKPITSWGNMDDAFTDVARGIRKAIAEMMNDVYHKPGTPEPGQTFDQVKIPGGSRVSADRGGVAFGDDAQGNVAITGGMQGDFVKQPVVVENNQGEITIHHHHYAQSVPPPLHQHPSPPADFTGREAERAGEDETADDEQIKHIYNDLITLWRRGHVPTIYADFGTDRYRILEKMADKKMIERLRGVPGNYTLPGTVRLPR